MFNKLSKIFTAVMLGLVFVLPMPVSAACTLSNATWSNASPVHVGDSIGLNVNGQECDGLAVSFDLYEWDPARNDYLRTLNSRITNGSATVSYVFTNEDFVNGGNEYVGETIFFRASVFDSSGTRINTTDSSRITLLNTGPGAGGPTGGDIRFSVNPATSNALRDQAIPLTFTAEITIQGQEFRNYCGANARRATWEVYQVLTSGGPDRFDYPPKATQTVDIPNQVQPFQQTYSNSASIRGAVFDGSRKLYAELKCGSGGADLGSGGSRLITRSSVVVVTGASGGGGGCGTTDQPACAPGSSRSFDFEIRNPLKGGADDFSELVTVLAQWIFNLSIPIAVAMIVYSGILFLTAAGDTTKVTKAKDVLKWAVVGLAIILIGSGFVTLIQSILELGGTGGTPTTNPGGLPPPGSGGGNPTQPGTGIVGNRCSRDRDCISTLGCQDSICKRPTGNWVNEPCNSARNCDVGLLCDKSDSGLQPIDGQNLGTCMASGVAGGRIGDVCERDSNCISGLRCNQICQRRDGNLIGEACVRTASPSNCQSRACSTIGGADVGRCVTNPSN